MHVSYFSKIFFYCSYDTRGPHNEVATHWHDDQILDKRAFFRTITEPSTLSIEDITEADEGEYRCRIDYLRSPTKNIRVKLSIIGKCYFLANNIFYIFNETLHFI